jgi:NitT/TauT family transport system ATP-binding protein
MIARPNSFLVFDGVTKKFGDLPVVETPFHLTIPLNQFVVFLGPSGCGKTTLMRMVGGLDKPTGGRILLEGQRVGRPDRQRGMVFQSYSSFPWLTVRENVLFGMKYRLDLTPERKKERCEHYLGLVGLTEFADSYPNQVSGGMRQRVAIARTLASGSEVLLMDEPFGALDAQRREQLQIELRRIQKEEARTVIFVTHDVEEAVFLADRIILFSQRPATIVRDIDVTAVIGSARDAELRESPTFLDLRSDVLRLLRTKVGTLA